MGDYLKQNQVTTLALSNSWLKASLLRLKKNLQKMKMIDTEPIKETPDIEDATKTSNSKRIPVKNANLVKCNLCGVSGFKNNWFLQRHLSQMHLGSIKCEICSNIFVDKFHYLQHSNACFPLFSESLILNLHSVGTKFPGLCGIVTGGKIRDGYCLLFY